MIGMCKSKAVPFLKMKKASPVQAIDRVVFMPGPVMLQEKPKKTVKPKAGEFCQVCELVVGYMDNMLKNNATEVRNLLQIPRKVIEIYFLDLKMCSWLRSFAKFF